MHICKTRASSGAFPIAWQLGVRFLFKFSKVGRKMSAKFPIRGLVVGLFAVFLLAGVSFAAINLATEENPLPEETPVSVVEKFYEYLSEAKFSQAAASTIR